MQKILLALAGVMVVTCALWAADWPQFQGPDRNGISPEKGLAKAWPEKGPKELWSFDLGVGFAGPVIQDGKVYILDRVEDKQDVLRCIDLIKGTEDWKYAYDAPGKLDYNGSRSSLALDDKNVYLVSPFGLVQCISKKTHEPVWKTNFLTDFGGKMPRWGYSQSVALYKDMAIVAPQSDKAGIVALSKDKGEVKWKSDPIGAPAYASPYVTKVGGVDTVVLQTADRCVGVDANTGKVLWSHTDWKCNWPIPSPTDIGDGRFLVTGGYGAGCVMIKAEKVGDEWKATQVYKNKSMSSKIHNAILYEGHLYGNSNDNGAGLVCTDLDGTVLWTSGKAVPYDMGGLIITADGLIYIMEGQGGVLHLIEANPKEYKELAKAKILSSQNIWAPMALSDGKLVLRDQKQLKCLDVKNP